MHKPTNRYVGDVVELRGRTIELLVVAVALALAISLIATAAPQLAGFGNEATLVIGCVLFVLCLSYFYARLRPSLAKTCKFRGVLAVDKSNNPVRIERYGFAEKAQRYVSALGAENKALGQTWARGGTNFPNQHRMQLNRELTHQLIEYFVLNELSLHLSEYFESDRNVDSTLVAHIKRVDIPQILFSNRFLELFSKPLDQRDAFMDGKKPQDGEVVFAIGKDGQLFDHFELALPKGTRLSRTPVGVKLKTRRFVLDINPIYDGFSTNLPSDFENLYMGCKFDTIDRYLVQLEVKMKFRWWSLMTPTGWDFYEWIDSFVDRIELTFSFEKFTQDIGWQSAHSTAIALQNTMQSSQNRLTNRPSGRP
jgi:hypothetical protein